MNIACTPSNIVFVFCSLICIQNIFSQTTFCDKSVLQTTKLNKPIKLTGRLEDPAWSAAVGKGEVLHSFGTFLRQYRF